MNFGWPITEGNMIEATGERVTPATAPPNYLGPITVRRQIDGDTAVVGGFVDRDPNLAPLAGRYVYVDYFNGVLRSARLSVGGTIDDKEIAGLDSHQDQDAFGQDQCGRLYVVQITGPVYRLTSTGPSTMGQEAQGVDCVPLPTTSPSVKTTTAPVAGVKLASYRGAWSGQATGYRLQWVRCDSDGTSNCSNVTSYSADNGSYTPAAADVGHTLRIRVIATNGTGDSVPTLSAPTAPVTPDVAVPTNTTLPAVKTSTPQVGVKLGANQGQWAHTPTAYRFQWVRCDADGTSNCTDDTPYRTDTGTYTPTSADLGGTLRVRVIATNANGDSTPALSAPSAVVAPNPGAPTNTTLPSTKTSTPQVGIKMGANVGRWTATPTAYRIQWVRCDADGTSNCAAVTAYRTDTGTYTPTFADAGHTLRVQVIASNASGDSWPALSGPTQPVM
jgi:hypothetical protein